MIVRIVLKVDRGTFLKCHGGLWRQMQGFFLTRQSLLAYLIVQTLATEGILLSKAWLLQDNLCHTTVIDS